MTDLFTLVALALIGISIQQGNWISWFTQGGGKSTQEDKSDADLLSSKLDACEQTKKRIEESLAELEVMLSNILVETDSLYLAKARLEARVTELEARVKDQDGNLSALPGTSAADDLRSQLAACRDQLSELEAKFNAKLSELSTCMSRATLAERQLSEEVAKSKALREELQRLRSLIDNQKVSTELLGLHGRFKRVVFLLDRSSSMDKRDRDDRDRWSESIDTIKVWLQYLPVNEVALITFGADINEYPSPGTFSRKRDGIDPLIRAVQELRPNGETKTMEALERAYRLPDVDAIFLFTDGMPNSTGGTDKDIRRFVQAQRAAGNNVRINTVGVGDYFNRDMGEFLRGLAADTGGTFIGR